LRFFFAAARRGVSVLHEKVMFTQTRQGAKVRKSNEDITPCAALDSDVCASYDSISGLLK